MKLLLDTHALLWYTLNDAKLLGLPFSSVHKDPFDRLLVAQAMAEQLPIVIPDPQLDAYPIQRLWK